MTPTPESSPAAPSAATQRPAGREAHNARRALPARLAKLFVLPAALFVAQFTVRVLRFPDKWVLADLGFVGGELLVGVLLAAVAGGLVLLLAQIAAWSSRRRVERKAACFLGPALVVLSLYAFFFLWLEAGAAMETRTLARMDRKWADANPQTADDVRRIFGEPDQTEPFRARNSETRWLYHPLPFVCAPLATPYQVWLDADGNIVGHGHRGD